MAAMICEWGQDKAGQGGGSIFKDRSWVPEPDSQLDLSCSAIWYGDQLSECGKGLKCRLPTVLNTSLNADPACAWKEETEKIKDGTAWQEKQVLGDTRTQDLPLLLQWFVRERCMGEGLSQVGKGYLGGNGWPPDKPRNAQGEGDDSLGPSAWKEGSGKDGVGRVYPWRVKERKQAGAIACPLWKKPQLWALG